MKPAHTSTPSIFSAVCKLKALLTSRERLTWLGIACFALFVSLLEVVTASVIVVLAQVLNDPNIGLQYLQRFDILTNLSTHSIILYISMTVGILYLVKNGIAAAEALFQNFSIQKMGYEFKNKLLHQYAQADYGFYITRNSYFGMQLINVDVEQTFTNGATALLGMFSESLVLLCLIGFIIFMNPSLALFIFAIGGLLAIFAMKCVLPRLYRWGERLQAASLQAGQHLMQFFQGFKDITLFGKKNYFIHQHQLYSQEKAKVQAIQTTASALPRMVIETLFVGLFVMSIIYLSIGGQSPMNMIGLLSGYLYVGFRIMPGLNRMLTYTNTFKTSVPYIERVYHEYHTIASKQPLASVPDFTFQREITTQNVSFRYLNTHNNVLSNINLSINKGDCIGIVGETGSGKSTLIDLLLGLLHPTEGKVLVDGQYPVNSRQWHQQIGYVPQSVYLMDGSIEANIAFGESSIDEQKLQEAIGAAQLQTFIDTLPEKTATFVGERGVRLSGGQRQRIAIARALYHRPEVLVFDEATSALDTETEARLMETIHTISQNRTVIMIAHRLSTLRNCNAIVCMNNGEIERITTYDDLIKTNDEVNDE